MPTGRNTTSRTGGIYTEPAVDYSGTPLAGASSATAFNVGNAGQVGGIADLINSINLKAQQTANANRIPNDPALEAKSSANIGDELAGKVPTDVMQLLQQQAAERGVGSGVGADSPNASAAYLKALGLTSLDQMKTGQSNLTAADARNPGAPIFDAATQLLTPYQGAQLGLQSGQLTLEQKTEADRTAMERERLALEGANLHSRNNPFSTGYGSPSGYPSTIATGNTGGILDDHAYGPLGSTSSYLGAPDYSTADWWSSIGFKPGQGVTPGPSTPPTQGTTFGNGDYYDYTPTQDAVYG